MERQRRLFSPDVRPRMDVVPRVSKSHLQISGGEISVPPRVSLLFSSHHNRKEASHFAELCGLGAVSHTHTRTHTPSLSVRQMYHIQA